MTPEGIVPLAPTAPTLVETLTVFLVKTMHDLRAVSVRSDVSEPCVSQLGQQWSWIRTNAVGVDDEVDEVTGKDETWDN